MRIIVTGGTGFIGRPLVSHLTSLGHSCFVLTRNLARTNSNPRVVFASWDEPLPTADAAIHLAGESIVGLWTKGKRTAILESRIQSTRRLVAGLGQAGVRTLLSASAIGYYGDRPGETLTEESPPDPNAGFRSRVCQQWEAEANQAIAAGVRVVNLRIANVLHSSGGYLGSTLPLYRCGLSFAFGPADTMISWISLQDAIRMITFALFEERIMGPLNVAAPSAATQSQLSNWIATQAGTKVRGRVPGWLLRAMLGELSTSLLDSQHVLPRKASGRGFDFNHSTLEQCPI